MHSQKILSILLHLCAATLPSRSQLVRLQSGHTSVPACIFYLNDSHIITGGLDQQLITWDINSAKEINRYELSAAVSDIDVDPRQKRIIIAAGATIGLLQDGNLEKLPASVSADDIRQVRISPDGQSIASLDYQGKLLIRNAHTFKLQDSMSQKNYIKSFNFIPGSTKLVLANAVGEISTWDIQSDSVTRIMQSEMDINVTAVSGDGKFLAVGGESNSVANITLIERATNTVYQLAKQPGRIMRIMFSPDSRQFVTCGSEGYIHTWNAINKQHLQQLSDEPVFPVLGVCYSANGHYLASCHNNNRIIVWDAATGTKLRVMNGYANESGVNSVAAAVNGKIFYSAHDDNLVRAWDLETQKIVGAVLPKHLFYASQVESSKNNLLVTTGTDKITVRNEKGQILKQIRNRENILYAQISPDGRHIVYTALDSIIVRSVFSDTVKAAFAVPDMHFALQAKFDNSGKKLVVGCSDGTARLYDLITMRSKVICWHEYAVQSVCFSPKGDYIISGSRTDGVVSATHLKSGNTTTSKNHTGTVNDLQFITDSSFISAGEDGKLVKWKLKPLQSQHEFDGHASRVNGFCLAAKKTKLISAGFDGTIKIWDLANGKLLSTLLAISGDTTNYISYTPTLYYLGTRHGIKAVHFLVGNQVCSFDQFDAYYNRPDKVLTRIGLASPAQIRPLDLAWKKRIARLGLDPSKMQADPLRNIPVVEVSHTDSLMTSVRSYTFMVKAEAAKSRLKALRVSINGAPVYGAKGRDLLRKQASVLENEKIEVQLSRGENIIEVSVVNENGVESIRKVKYLFYQTL